QCYKKQVGAHPARLSSPIHIRSGMSPSFKRGPRQGEYARSLLRDTPGAKLQLPSEGPGTYIPPVDALEAGVKVLYKYRPLGDLPVRDDGTTATEAAVQLLAGRKLYAASPSELNDLF